MAALIVRLAPRHARSGGEYRRVDGETLTIGRALDNDLIVGDAYLGARQFRLRRAGETIVLENLDRTNPLRVNGKLREEGTLELASGDELEIGHTLLTVLREDTPVAAVRVLPSTVWARLGVWRPLAAGVALAAVVAASVWVDYLATVEEPRWGELLWGAMLLGAVLLAWAALWAVVGRSIRQSAHFAGHLALASVVVLAAFALTTVIEYGLYALDFARFTNALDWSCGAVLLFALCWGEFRLATQLRRPALAAALATLLPMFALLGFEWAARAEFDPDPTVNTLLRPPFAKLADGRTAQDYDERLALLFEELRAD